MNQSKLITKFLNDENVTFKWDFGGQNVFLKVIYMPKTQIAGLKVREFSYKMTQTDEENIYDFDVDVNLKTLIRKFFECNEDFMSETNSKFEESKPQNDEKTLLSALKMFKSIQYVFEVDGQQKINVGDSLMSNSQNSPLIKKYQQLNEINIETQIQNMINPLTNYISNKRQPLNEKALAGLPCKFMLQSEPSSLRSDSTYMSSQQSLRSETSSNGICEPSSLTMDELQIDSMGSVNSPKNVRTSFGDDQDQDEVVGVCDQVPQQTLSNPPIAMNKWQRKHNNFVINALKMQQQLQLQAKKTETECYQGYSYCGQDQKSNCTKNPQSICCQSIICCCSTTTATTTTTKSNLSNQFNNNNDNNLNYDEHHHKHHHDKTKKRVTFAVDIDISNQMPQPQMPSMPDANLNKPSSSWKTFGFWPARAGAAAAKNTTLCY